MSYYVSNITSGTSYLVISGPLKCKVFICIPWERDLNCETHTMRLTKKGFVAQLYYGVSVRLSARALTSF